MSSCKAGGARLRRTTRSIGLSLALAALISGASPTAAAVAGPAGTYSTGVNTGAWTDHTAPANDLALLGARNARLGVAIGTSTSTLDASIAKYHAKGIAVMLLAEFTGRIPSAAEARNVATWAARYGAGGSFWVGKASPTPVKWIEFGNETSYTYQWADNSTATYAQRAKDYAIRFKEARSAMNAAGPAGSVVGLLCQSDPNPGWARGMFAQVPDLESHVAGWTMHPYGPVSVLKSKLDGAMNNLRDVGAAPSAGKPMFVTEYGIASDDGRNLNYNYGWPTNLTYAQAGASYLTAEREIRRTYGALIRLFIAYGGRDLEESGVTNNSEKYFGSLRRNHWGLTGTGKGGVTDAIRTIMNRGA